MDTIFTIAFGLFAMVGTLAALFGLGVLANKLAGLQDPSEDAISSGLVLTVTISALLSVLWMVGTTLRYFLR